jgi:hypothetical protein
VTSLIGDRSNMADSVVRKETIWRIAEQCLESFPYDPVGASKVVP